MPRRSERPKAGLDTICDGMPEHALRPRTMESPSRAELEGLFPASFAGASRKSWQTRRLQKLIWFLALESAAVFVMVGSMVAGLSERFTSEVWALVVRVLPVTAAVVAAILPIFFYGNARGSRR